MDCRECFIAVGGFAARLEPKFDGEAVVLRVEGQGQRAAEPVAAEADEAGGNGLGVLPGYVLQQLSQTGAERGAQQHVRAGPVARDRGSHAAGGADHTAALTAGGAEYRLRGHPRGAGEDPLFAPGAAGEAKRAARRAVVLTAAGEL